jgi:hypothetical protein
VNLAATLASESRLADARAAIESALRIDPKDPDALRLNQMLAGAHTGASATGLTPRQPGDQNPH